MPDVGDDAQDALAQQVESLSETVSELASNLERVTRENETLTKIVTADAALAGAVATIKRQEAEIQALRERVAGLQDEKNAAVRQAQSAQRTLKKLEAKKA